MSKNDDGVQASVPAPRVLTQEEYEWVARQVAKLPEWPEEHWRSIASMLGYKLAAED